MGFFDFFKRRKKNVKNIETEVEYEHRKHERDKSLIGKTSFVLSPFEQIAIQQQA